MIRNTIYSFLLVIFIILASYHNIYAESVETQCKINNKHELIDDNNYSIEGTSSGEGWELFVNNEKVLSVDKEKFIYNVNLEKYKEEWIFIDCRNKQVNSKVGGAIHLIKNQASVFIPYSIILAARSFNEKYYKATYKVRGRRIPDDYSATGRYFSSSPIEKETDDIHLENGLVPKVRYGKENEYFFAWNPVTVIQAALGYYSRFIDNGKKRDLSNFIELCDWLVDFQRYDGSFRYEFPFPVKPDLQLEKGWVSAMAQGQFLSAMARAWDITGNIKYLKSGKLGLDFMLSSGEIDNYAGTQKSLDDFVANHPSMSAYKELKLGQEYVTKKSIYVLNGDLFGLLGLYDWSQIATTYYGKHDAEKYFAEGVKAVEVLLPYYDYYGWSSYDLGQYTHGSSVHLGSSYAHRVHCLLLDILGAKTDSEKLKKYADRFWSYVDDDSFRQTEINRQVSQ